MAADRWYAIVDSAQDPALLAKVKSCRQHACLISGELDPVLAAALPWIVALDPEEQLAMAWRVEGEGRNWGILVQSPLDLDQLKRHFKKFLNAKLPDGMIALFRFYDPRVMRAYLRAANMEERESWFQGVTRYSIETEQAGQYHDFTIRDGRLFDGAQPVTSAAV
jgi:hypothetical protein